MKFKLDENLPVSSTAILTSAGHDVDTVTQEGLIGAPDQDVVAAALRGHFGAHHAIAAARILAHLDFLDEAIGALDAQIAARVAERYQPAARLLADVPGLARRSAEVIIAETGADMSGSPARRTWPRGREYARATTSRLASVAVSPPRRAISGCAAR